MREQILTVVEELRERADMLGRFGAEGQAKATRKAADVVEERFRKALETPLTLKDAAAESGYSTEHLGRLVRQSVVPNAGSTNAPRIRRRDLPRKPGHRVPVASGNGDSVPSKAQIARSVVNSDEGEDDG